MKKTLSVVAAGATVALVGAAAGASASAPAVHRAHAHMPKISVVATKHSFKVKGPKTFAAGRVALSLKSVGSENEAEVVQLKNGYTLKDARADLTAFGEAQGSGPNGSTPKSALKHLNRAINHVRFFGGLDASSQTESGTFVLPKPGKYLVLNDTNLPEQARVLRVTGPAVHRKAPKSTAAVVALTKRRFGGSKTLPHNGTITFKNDSSESPHFLNLLHVKKGTTKKQVFDYLMSGSQGPPPFGLPGQAGTDVVGKGNSMTFSYSAPKGEYVEACFFPDPKTGMPHALMGMLRIVTLK
jgi:hypothetical protein